MKKSVLSRAVLYVLLPLLAAHVLVTAIHVQDRRDARRVAVDQHTRNAAESVAAALDPDEPTASVRLAALAERLDLTRLWLLDDRGRLAASSTPSERGSLPDPAWQATMRDIGARGAHRVRRGSATYVLAVQPVNRQGFRAVAIYDVERAGSFGSTLWLTILPAALLYVLLAFVVLLFAVFAVQRPIELVEAGLDRLVRGEGTDEASLQRTHAGMSTGLNTLADRYLEAGRAFATVRTRLDLMARRYEALNELVPDVVLVCAFDGRILDANPAFCHLVGREAEALRGQPFDTLSDHLNFNPILSLAKRSLAQAEAFDDIEFGLRDAGGQTVPVRLRLRALPMNGAPVFLLVGQDLRTQKSLQHELDAYADSVQLVSAHPDDATVDTLLGHAVDSVGLLVAVFDGDGETVVWNGKARRLTGLTLADVPDDAAVIARVMPTSERERFARWFASTRESGLTAPLREAPGTTRALYWYHASLPDGEGRALLGLDLAEFDTPRPSPSPSEDTTDTPSAGLVVDALHTPLKATGGFATLLAQHVEPDGESALYLDLIQQSVRRMSDLVDAYALTRAAGDLADLSDWHDGRALVEEAVRRAVPEMHPEGTRVDVDLGVDLPRLWGQETLLLMMLEALLTHAVPHTADAPHRTVYVTGTSDQTASALRLDAPDSVFLPHTDTPEGALATAGALAAWQGGRLEWGAAGAGSFAQVHLPLPVEEAADAPPAASPTEAESAGERDANTTPRDIVSEILDDLDDLDELDDER